MTEKYEMDWIIDEINGENGRVDALKGAIGEKVDRMIGKTGICAKL